MKRKPQKSRFENFALPTYRHTDIPTKARDPPSYGTEKKTSIPINAFEGKTDKQRE